MGKSQRVKGHGFERELVHVFREAFPGFLIKRGYQPRSKQITADRQESDVVTPWFWVEAKRGKRPGMRAALRQAESETKLAQSDKIPLAVVRDDGDTRAMVVLRLDDFLGLVRNLWGVE